MIAINHPALGMNPHQGGDSSPIFGPGIRPQPLQPLRVAVVPPAPTTPPAAAPNPVSSPSSVNPLLPHLPPASEGPGFIPASSSGAASGGAVPTHVSNLVDPVTGITYAGYLTADAQTLYNSGSLVTGGNELTTQGSALAAQGDLIQGTPAPSAAQIAAAVPASPSSGFMNWLTEETLFSGYPNGLVAAGGVILLAWMFGGKKGRR